MKENPEGKDNLEKIEIKQLWMAKSLLSPLQVLLIIKRKKEED